MNKNPQSNLARTRPTWVAARGGAWRFEARGGSQWRPAAPGARGADPPSGGGLKSQLRQWRASRVLWRVRKGPVKGHGGAQILSCARPRALDPQRRTYGRGKHMTRKNTGSLLSIAFGCWRHCIYSCRVSQQLFQNNLSLPWTADMGGDRAARQREDITNFMLKR